MINGELEKNMNDINYASVCGVYCKDCEHLNKACKGCGYEQGKTFWTNIIKAKDFIDI